MPVFKKEPGRDLDRELKALGFVRGVDYRLQDDWDGRGPYIVEWKSEQPCPLSAKINEPEKPA